MEIGRIWKFSDEFLHFLFTEADAVIAMSGTSSVQAAHDELLRVMPEGGNHDDCPFCEKDSSLTEKAKEVVPMSDEKIYSETQHIALVTSAVERETLALTESNESLTAEVASLKASATERETASTDLSNQVDVLESEKAAEVQRADAAEKALADFKAELAELAAVEARKGERVSAIRAADESLSDEYFTDTRVQRWAQMADAQFAELVEDLTEAAAKKKVPAPAAKGDQVDGDGDADETPTLRQNARETAAFKGGDPVNSPVVSLTGSWLSAIGKLPAAANN